MSDIKKKFFLLQEDSLSNISDITVQEFEPPSVDGIVSVTVTFSDSTTISYNAYAVRDMSLDQYLDNDDEMRKAAQLTKGCFTLPDGDQNDRIQAHLFSSYAQKVNEYRQRVLGSRVGETRMRGIREYYETLRGTVEEIVLNAPDINDYQLAKKLNELGTTTQSGISWRVSNVRGLRDYLKIGSEYVSETMER